jgi:chromosome partitioning protein
MAVVVFSSPKGGAGKTTAATVLATELAQQGATVTVIDADPNQNVMDFAKLGDLPPTMKVVGGVTEETIIDQIDEAAAESSFVIVDLEGTASLMSGYAISQADLVIIPVQGSQMDAKQAARQIKQVKGQERVARRPIPYVILFTRTNPAIQPKTLRFIDESFRERDVPVMETQLYDREVFRALFSFGGTLAGLADKGVSNLDTGLRNARSFTAEVIERLRAAKKSNTGEAA